MSPFQEIQRPISRTVHVWVVACVLLGLPTVGQAQQTANAAGDGPRLPREFHEQLALQVALDRAGFSPGEIDARAGRNTREAVAAFQRSRGLDPSGAADPPTLEALAQGRQQATTTYVITAEDAIGPFTADIPEDMLAKASLPALSYTSIIELLAERFHASPQLLRRLNPGMRFVEGDTIVVPDVEPFFPPEASGARREQRELAKKTKNAEPTNADDGRRVIVSAATSSLRVEGPDGTVLMHAPVTSGSEHDPLPIGEWKITGVFLNPKFHYNPDLFWDADPSHSKATLPPGANSPVGVVWIDLDKPHYGLHGTPEPSHVGHTASHGCIRLTNWDAMRVAALVGKGTRVTME